MPEIKVPQKRNFGAPPERNFFADTETSAPLVLSVPKKPREQKTPRGETPPKKIEKTSARVSSVAVPKKTVDEEKLKQPFENSTGDLPPLRTYKQDVADVVRDKKTSLVQLVLAEQKERTRREKETSPTSGRNLPLIILSVIFLFSAAGIVYYIFFTLKPTNNTLEALNVEPLIFSESNAEIPVNGKDRKTLRKDMSGVIQNKNLRLDAIEYVFFTDALSVTTPQGPLEQKSLVTADKFFEIFGIKLPSIIVRSLRPEFMFGVHAFNRNQPFIILKTDYYDNTFAGMLEWEHDAISDLLTLFDRPEQVRELSERKWGDLVIKNKDTRVLRAFNGLTALIYMFKDQRTLIITTNEDTLLEVSRRLDTVQGKPVKD